MQEWLATSTSDVADSVGFGYGWDDEKQEYAHGAGLFLLTPDGTLARVLEGVNYSENLRFALLEAGEGRIGTPVQRFLLKWCYSYDATAGKYVVAARKIMAYSGVLIVLLTFTGLVFLWRRDLRVRAGTARVSKAAPIPEPHT